MPYINNPPPFLKDSDSLHPRSNINNKTTPFPDPKKDLSVSKVPVKKDSSSVDGSVDVSDIRRFLKTPLGQRYIRDKFEISPNLEGYFKKIEELSETILEKFEEYGRVFDSNEKRSQDSSASKVKKWSLEKQHLREDMKDRIVTYQEEVEREHREKIRPVMDDLVEKFKR
ncbi:MAG: hypothetical protein A2908_02725 [Candidatus Staskawiczbacteria bacterium RIFCSPLOWO2_01_FULL_38_12b]|uniref:Uncharacterized protein n=1 Tax=Candidatus Staskawiczbacteria bacterium RIFCSPLOWO2_01_FULL_38_12b TaxID=1802214 RepID=A0A1G2IE57_9BACT|nr:MAG: hypothetical protein A2908_02725 [Candidatus Staskawiczbacteria bacterium RIFCSPLOWO2_01_FULL_38_12b]